MLHPPEWDRNAIDKMRRMIAEFDPEEYQFGGTTDDFIAVALESTGAPRGLYLQDYVTDEKAREVEVQVLPLLRDSLAEDAVVRKAATAFFDSALFAGIGSPRRRRARPRACVA